MVGAYQYCASERVVPVLYARMARANWKPGNQYRPFRRECERWLPCCDKQAWRFHDDPHVLPADSDPDDPSLIPTTETEFADRLPENIFECPSDGCEAVHEGYPESCDTCGTPYNWQL